ncbi:MAG: response regulator, partial [Thiogranum sp.]
HADEGLVAVTVDQVVNSYDLVIKSTGRYVQHVHGVAGVSILGDGSVVPVLNLPELLRKPPVAGALSVESHADEGRPLQQSSPLSVLIVDDSLSVRKSLSQLVADAGYQPIAARDGLEAVELLAEHKPDIVLADLEMPRMTGLELTSHIRADGNLADLPVIMITSRTMQKHRQQAEKAGVSDYMTKPFSEDDLLAAMESALRVH